MKKGQTIDLKKLPWYNGSMAIEGYRIVRSRRKTLSLCVSREGEVVVRAPLTLSAEYIGSFVEKHSAWLQKKVAEANARPKLDLSDGARVVLFGTQYTLASGRTGVKGTVLYLPEAGREEALTRFLKRFSLEVMRILTDRIARTYGFRHAGVRISSARGRWGSCNKEGMIAYSFRVAFLPPALCEYVAVHELSHTVVFDHSPAFWKVVEEVLPDWKSRRKALKSNGSMGYL